MATKKRNWAFVLYPDSAPEDWIDRLKQYGVPAAISPLHDSDLTKEGEPKKPHYHILLAYKHPTTYNNVEEFVKSLAQNTCKPIQSLFGQFKYLAHENDPDKAQYKPEDIQLLNGFRPPREKMESDDVVLGLFAFIRDNQITDYAYLIDVLSQANELDLLQYAVCHAYAVISYLRSACQQ